MLVRPFEPEEIGPAGIIIPDAAQEKPQRGTVLAVGPGAATEQGVAVPVGVEPGDVVYFSKYGGQVLKIEGEELTLLRESDLLGIEAA